MIHVLYIAGHETFVSKPLLNRYTYSFQVMQRQLATTADWQRVQQQQHVKTIMTMIRRTLY